MFFIFGTRVKQKEISAGSFYCPHCRTQRAYKLMQVGQYFSLYFIPLFRIKDLGQHVVCQHCQQAYKPEVLNMKIPVEQTLTARDRLVLSIRKELEEGMPVHMMKRKLLSQKMDELSVDQYVGEALKGKIISCNECGFEYISGVQRCLNCNSELPQL